MSSKHRSPVIVGLLAAALVSGPAWANESQTPASAPAGSRSHSASGIAAKKKSAKGTLSITVSGSGSYTVTGKGFRKSSTASKSYKVKPGVYTVKAPTGSVTPSKAKVRKGRATRVTVTFRTVPDTPTPTDPAPTQNPPVPTPTPTPSTPPPTTDAVQRVSTNASGGQGNHRSEDSAWSPDGSKIAFTSAATDLVSGDTNDDADIFVKTLATGAIQRINTDATGAQTTGGAYSPAWSPDGTQVAFVTNGADLVSGDTNQDADIFVKTLATGAIQRINTDATGAQATGDQGNGWSYGPAWSPDGQKIAFVSHADNLVPEYDGNSADDIFVKTLSTGAIQRISADSGGNIANGRSFEPTWSPDSSRVAFASAGDNLVTGDSNGVSDVFVKTLASGAIQRISTDAVGNEAAANGTMVDFGSISPAWSPDGTKIVFVSDANNLVSGDTNGSEPDIFVKTLSNGSIERISTDATGQQVNGADYPVWSPDGTRIAFLSYASNLVTGDTNNGQDVFVKTLATGAVQRVSTGSDGHEANGLVCARAEWSPDGTRIAFDSDASNLVPGDTNNATDVFVKTLG